MLTLFCKFSNLEVNLEARVISAWNARQMCAISVPFFRASFTNDARASMRVDTRDSTGAFDCSGGRFWVTSEKHIAGKKIQQIHQPLPLQGHFRSPLEVRTISSIQMRRDRLQTRELPIENQTLSNSHLIRNSPTFQHCSNSSNTKMPSFSDATDNHSPPGDQTNESQIVKTKLAARTCDSCNNVLWRVFNFLFKLHKNVKGLLSNDCKNF